MKDIEDLRTRAQKRLRAIERLEATPRFRGVIGRYVAAGLLTANYAVETNRRPMRIDDVLWAGELEPRMLELLPAMIVKRPSLFVDVTKLPEDLAAAVEALRRNQVPPDFRGLPGKSLYQWLPRVGRKGKVPSRLRAFRFSVEDSNLLEDLQQRFGVSQMDVLRRALRLLDRTQREERAQARRNSFPGFAIKAGEEKPPLYLEMSVLERFAHQTALSVRNAALSGHVPSKIPRSQWPGEIFKIGKSSDHTR